jgi:hypothetical protein
MTSVSNQKTKKKDVKRIPNKCEHCNSYIKEDQEYRCHVCNAYYCSKECKESNKTAHTPTCLKPLKGQDLVDFLYNQGLIFAFAYGSSSYYPIPGDYEKVPPQFIPVKDVPFVFDEGTLAREQDPNDPFSCTYVLKEELSERCLKFFIKPEEIHKHLANFEN